MKRRQIIGGVVGVLLVALLVANLAIATFAQGPTSPQARTAEQDDSGPDEQSPGYDSSIRVDDAQYEGMSETDKVADLATVTPEQAKAAAIEAYPGTTAAKVELDNENGALVYSVELSSGLDVKVDAGDGAVLYVDG